MRLDRTYRDLGSLCTIKGRIGFRGYTREDLVNKGEGAITLSPSNIIDDKLDLTKCSYISWFKYNESPEIMIFEGDIIYAKTASIGKVAIVDNLPEKATINPQFVVLKDIKCNRRYLYYCLRSTFFRAQADNIVRGVAIPTLSQANLSLLSVPIPPLAEQERIVAELDLLSGIIDKQKAQLKELDILAQSIFYDMFGNPVENEKGWTIRRLEDYCEVSSAKRVLVEEVVDSGIPFLRGTELTALNKAVSSKDVQFTMFITPEHYERLKAITGVPKKGDILIPSINSDGITWVVDTDNPFYFKDGRVIWVHVNNDVFSSMYLKNAISQVLKANYEILTSGATFLELKLFIVRDLLVPIPPVELQNDYSQKITFIESQKESINQSIAESQKLFDYTMDKYFS